MKGLEKDFPLACRVAGALFHDLGSNGCHLGSGIRRFDTGHDISAEGGSCLEQEICFGFDIEAGAIGGQSRSEGDGHAGREATADGGGAVKDHGGFMGGAEVAEDLRIAFVLVGGQIGMIGREDVIGAGFDKGAGHCVGDGVSEEDSAHALVQFIGQFPRFSEQFEGDVLKLLAIPLCVDPDVLIVLGGGDGFFFFFDCDGLDGAGLGAGTAEGALFQIDGRRFAWTFAHGGERANGNASAALGTNLGVYANGRLHWRVPSYLAGDQGQGILQLFDQPWHSFLGFARVNFSAGTDGRSKDSDDAGWRAFQTDEGGVTTEIGGCPNGDHGFFRVHFALEGRDTRLVDLLDDGEEAGEGGFDGFVPLFERPLGHDSIGFERFDFSDVSDLGDVEVGSDAGSHLGRIAVCRLFAAEDEADVAELFDCLGEGVTRGPGVTAGEGAVGD